MAKDRTLEDFYNGVTKNEQEARKLQAFGEEDEIKEFEVVGDLERYLVVDLDETLIHTEFLTKGSNVPELTCLELEPGKILKVSFSHTILKCRQKYR